MAITKISWTKQTWNPTTGCDKISAGCKNCYAQPMTIRLQGNPKLTKYRLGWKFAHHPEEFERPYHWQKPALIFVNSMSDLFHKDCPTSFIKGVFKSMNENPHHIFQVLTKRPEILNKYAPQLTWSDNIWAGVTVENKQALNRIDILRNTKGIKHRFLSCEPLLEPLGKMNLTGIEWVIVGGESGRGCRPIQQKWVEEIQRQCNVQKVPFFFKQWGGVHAKKNGNVLNGKVYETFPPEMKSLMSGTRNIPMVTQSKTVRAPSNNNSSMSPSPEDIQQYILKHGNKKSTYEMASDLGVTPIRIAGGVAALKRAKRIDNNFLFFGKGEPSKAQIKRATSSSPKAIDKNKVMSIFHEYETRISGLLKELSEELEKITK